MNSFAKAFTYLIAAQVQAVMLLLFAWYAGDWLNQKHAQSFNWYIVTFGVGILATAQTFYVVVRHAIRREKLRTGGSMPTSDHKVRKS